LDPDGFNHHTDIPHGLAVEHVKDAVQGFVAFLGFLNVAARFLHGELLRRCHPWSWRPVIELYDGRCSAYTILAKIVVSLEPGGRVFCVPTFPQKGPRGLSVPV
jgi:hypothetical protein